MVKRELETIDTLPFLLKPISGTRAPLWNKYDIQSLISISGQLARSHSARKLQNDYLSLNALFKTNQAEQQIMNDNKVANEGFLWPWNWK